MRRRCKEDEGDGDVSLVCCSIMHMNLFQINKKSDVTEEESFNHLGQNKNHDETVDETGEIKTDFSQYYDTVSQVHNDGIAAKAVPEITCFLPHYGITENILYRTVAGRTMLPMLLLMLFAISTWAASLSSKDR